MNEKLNKILQESNESSMQKLFQEAHLPRHLGSFNETLRLAKERRQGRQRALVACASLIVLSALAYTFWPTPKGQSPTGALLQPVETKEIASTSQPENKAEDKPAGVFDGPRNKIKMGALEGILLLNGKPAEGFRIEIDGKMTGFRTPITAPGLALAAGGHHIAFYNEDLSVTYGPVWVEVFDGKTTREDFSFLSVEAPLPSVVIEESKGYLIVNTFPLIDMTVVIDGKKTRHQTPVGAPGILLSAGEHSLTFVAASGEEYGPFSVEVNADETIRQRFNLQAEATSQKLDPKVEKIGGKVIPFNDMDPNTIANPFGGPYKKAEGFLVVSTLPLIGLEVIVDGVNTKKKTPVSDGISLSPGRHKIEFYQSSTGKKFGPYRIKIVNGETNYQKIDLK